MHKILGQPVRRIVLPLGWDRQERSLQGSMCVFHTCETTALKTASKKEAFLLQSHHPCRQF